MTSFEIVADGLAFPEGPLMMPDGSIVVCEIRGERLTRIGPGGERETLAEIAGGPNGAALGPDGSIYVCNNGGFVYADHPHYPITIPAGTPEHYRGGSIERVDPATGAVETLYRGTPERPLRGPNDIIFDRHGGFWFTDHGKNFHRSRDKTGVFYARADGSGIDEVLFPMENPNGIGLSPDGTRLYVAETWTCQLWAFDLDGPGRIRAQPNLIGHGGRFLYRPPGFRHFDSLAVEAEGNICVATIGEPHGISVVSPEGELVDFVETPDIFTTNICFGGADRRDAYLTMSGTGRLLKCRWPRAGLALNF